MISTKKITVEDCYSIDIRRWHREGLLQLDRAFRLRWAGDDGALEVAVQVKGDYVTLSCRFTRHGWNPEIFSIIRLDSTPCHFGRERDWFLCPGIGCGRRVAVLYLRDGEFACRHCCRLAYQSQRERETFRACRRARKIRFRLNGSINLTISFPDKPKRMHWRTYMALRHESEEAEAIAWAGMAAWLERHKKGQDTSARRARG